MLYFLYDSEINNNSKKVGCLSLKEVNGKIVNSKFIQDSFELDEDISIKWKWADLNKENHVFVGKDNIPEILIPYVSILKESFDKKEFSEINNKNKEQIDPYLKDLESMVNMFKKFIEFTNDPSKVHEFKEFNEFIIKHSLKDYQVEDWLIDMENLFS